MIRNDANKVLADLMTVAGQLEQIAKCAACGARNRVTHTQLEKGRKPRCGKCGLPLKGYLT